MRVEADKVSQDEKTFLPYGSPMFRIKGDNRSCRTVGNKLPRVSDYEVDYVMHKKTQSEVNLVHLPHKN